MTDEETKAAAGTGNARAAAALLPGLKQKDESETEDQQANTVAGVFGLLVFVGMSIWVVVVVWREPWGWLLCLAGLPAWLLVRVAFFSLRGSETGIVTVDADGMIRLRTGHLTVRRLQQLFDVGSRRWMVQSVIGALSLFVGGLAALVVTAVVFDYPEVMLVFLATLPFATIDLLRWLFVALRYRRSKNFRRVDGWQILPALALYGRVHGWSAVLAGVPADRLAITLAEHPDELQTVRKYEKAATLIAVLARQANSWQHDAPY